MNTVTPNLGLVKPDHSEASSIDVLNVNSDVIDAVVGDVVTVESSPAIGTHAVGEYLLYAGHIYKVTAAVSAGDALVLGANVTPTNLGDELSSTNLAIATLRDSVARKSTAGNTAEALIYCEPSAQNRVSTRVKDSNGNTYLLIATDSYIQLYNATTSSLVWRITP